MCSMPPKFKKRDSEMISPRILSKSRTALKFANIVAQKYLSMSYLRAIVLDYNNSTIKVNKEDNSIISSTNEKDNDSDTSAIEDNLKCKVINSTK